MTYPKKPETPWSAKVFTIVAGIALGFVIAVPLFYRWNFGGGVSADSAQWNNFGTFVGGVLGPVLSVLAFFALVYTIFLQEQQLSLARATLKAADQDKELTRKQLEAAIETQTKTAEALALQNATSQNQVIQSKFFEMLRLHHEIATKLRFRSGMAAFDGREALRVLFSEIFGQIYSSINQSGNSQKQIDATAFWQFYNLYGHILGQFLRNLYQIFKFVDQSELDSGEKHDLIGILCAQLTNDELGLLYYFGISDRGDLLKPLLERYAAFQNFEQSALKNPYSYFDYDEPAWGDQPRPAGTKPNS